MTMTAARTAEQAATQAEFEAFYQRTARRLHGYLCRLSRNAATADEVLQEAYIRLINLPAMDEAPRKAYLYKTATNILRDRWRKFKREQAWWKFTIAVHVQIRFVHITLAHKIGTASGWNSKASATSKRLAILKPSKTTHR